MSVNHFVHCHICPLKDFCGSACPDASYRWYNQGKKKWSQRSDGLVIIEPHLDDLSNLQKATANCPLRRFVAYSETLQAKDLVRRIRKT